MYYVFVRRYSPELIQGVERWTLNQIKHFITQPDIIEQKENKGLTYTTPDCKIFITEDMKDLALQK